MYRCLTVGHANLAFRHQSTRQCISCDGELCWWISAESIIRDSSVRGIHHRWRNLEAYSLIRLIADEIECESGAFFSSGDRRWYSWYSEAGIDGSGPPHHMKPAAQDLIENDEWTLIIQA